MRDSACECVVSHMPYRTGQRILRGDITRGYSQGQSLYIGITVGVYEVNVAPRDFAGEVIFP